MVEKSDNVKDSSKLKFYTLLVHEELYARWRNEIPTRSDYMSKITERSASCFRCSETISTTGQRGQLAAVACIFARALHHSQFIVANLEKSRT